LLISEISFERLILLNLEGLTLEKDILFKKTGIMEKNETEVKWVEKETIDSLIFPKQEVLVNRETIQERIFALHRATSLGNLDKHKVVITFEDSEGIKKVNTTIWAITDRKILLKAGRAIPINRIHSVKIN